MHALLRFLTDTQGQDMVEYTLLLFFIGTVTVGLFFSFPDNLAGIWGKAQRHLDTAANGATPGL